MVRDAVYSVSLATLARFAELFIEDLCRFFAGFISPLCASIGPRQPRFPALSVQVHAFCFLLRRPTPSNLIFSAKPLQPVVVHLQPPATSRSIVAACPDPEKSCGMDSHAR